MTRLIVGLAFALAAFVLGHAPASAHDFSHGRTVLFHDVTIGPGDVVEGDLNVVFGNATIAGTVRGDLNIVGGTYQILPGAEIDGEVHNAAGSDALGAMMPWSATAGNWGWHPFARQRHAMWIHLMSSIVVLLVFLLFPLRVRLALDRVEQHPGLSAAVGTIAVVAIVPVAILLLLSIIGIPLIFLEFAAVFVGIWIGTGAVCLLVGRRLYELVSPNTTPPPLAALILGLVVVSAAQIVPVVGWAVTALIWLVGLGATILAFAREGYMRTLYARSPFGGGPPIGGPPMNRPA
jgi:hypothetical protein